MKKRSKDSHCEVSLQISTFLSTYTAFSTLYRQTAFVILHFHLPHLRKFPLISLTPRNISKACWQNYRILSIQGNSLQHHYMNTKLKTTQFPTSFKKGLIKQAIIIHSMDSVAIKSNENKFCIPIWNALQVIS